MTPSFPGSISSYSSFGIGHHYKFNNLKIVMRVIGKILQALTHVLGTILTTFNIWAYLIFTTALWNRFHYDSTLQTGKLHLVEAAPGVDLLYLHLQQLTREFPLPTAGLWVLGSWRGWFSIKHSCHPQANSVRTFSTKFAKCCNNVLFVWIL